MTELGPICIHPRVAPSELDKERAIKSIKMLYCKINWNVIVGISIWLSFNVYFMMFAIKDTFLDPSGG